jgi:glucan phosphoethanolaminetransferase (alkaline phosphatase superfamily)
MRYLKEALRFIQRWPDLIGLPIALLIFFFSAPALRWLDPTAAVFDFGILQKLLLCTLAMLTINTAVFMGIKFNFPSVYDYYKKTLSTDLNHIRPWQRIQLFLWLYVSLFLAGALIVSLF